MKWRISAVSVVFVVSLVQAPDPTTASPLLCRSSTAVGVVRNYYGALNRHQGATARACLTPSYLAQLRRVIDPDWRNVIAAHITKITARTVDASILPPDIKPAPYRAVQIFAQVIMRYRRVGGSPNGLNGWFIYVVKQHRASPWRIAGIGSGP